MLRQAWDDPQIDDKTKALAAQQLGIPRTWILSTTHGRPPKLEKAHRLAKALGVAITVGSRTARC